MKKKINIIKFFGIFLLPIVWLGAKNLFSISDRFLPSPKAVFETFFVLEPNIIIHFTWSFGVLILGYVGGVVIGLLMGLHLSKSRNLFALFYPTIQAIRSIPSVATIPFFLLWFGFEESGRLLLIFMGISFNLAITTIEILDNIPEKYSIFFSGINKRPVDFLTDFGLPFVLGKILPTLRFSLSSAIGLVVVSEMLGSQVGLGYLIQTSKSTFSMDVIFAAMLLFGLMNFISDKVLVLLWKKIIRW